LTISAFFLVSLAVRAAELISRAGEKERKRGVGESKLSFSKETRNCVGNKMKVTALGVPRRLFRGPSDVNGFANFVIKSNKKIETGCSQDRTEPVADTRRARNENIDNVRASMETSLAIDMKEKLVARRVGLFAFAFIRGRFFPRTYSVRLLYVFHFSFLLMSKRRRLHLYRDTWMIETLRSVAERCGAFSLLLENLYDRDFIGEASSSRR